MTLEIGILFAIIVLALVLFSLEKFPIDVIALGVLVSIVVLRLLPADQAFLGFSNDAVITIFGLFIMTAALLRTGLVHDGRRGRELLLPYSPGAFLPDGVRARQISLYRLLESRAASHGNYLWNFHFPGTAHLAFEQSLS